MTIRQTLRRWFRFLGLGLLVIGILAGSWRPNTWLDYYLRIAILAFLAVSVIGVFAFGFACPRCRRSLVLQAPAILDGRACACPRCGVSVDAPARHPVA